MAEAMNAATGAQLISVPDLKLVSPLTASFATYRKMRKHPTIAIARAFAVAPIVGAEWSVDADEGVPDDRIAFIQKRFVLPLRDTMVEAALFGDMDFGWQGFEKVFATDGGQVWIGKLKPLLHDITDILIDKATGEFAGYLQKDDNGNDITLPAENTLHIALRVEGTDWHGQSLLENALDRYNEWIATNESATRYDKKVAGTSFVVRYPHGNSIYKGVAETPHFDIAKGLLADLQSVGAVVIPRPKDRVPGDEDQWRIDLMSDPAPKQPSFIMRQEYLDVLMVRAFLLAERSMLEGKSGTKAEAGEHIGFAMRLKELQHKKLTQLVNEQCVDQLLAMNYGEEAVGTIRIVAAPLTTERRDAIRSIYEKVLSNPAGFLQEFETMDTDAIKDVLGVPKLANVAQAGEMLADPSDPQDTPGESPTPVQASFARNVYTGLGNGR